MGFSGPPPTCTPTSNRTSSSQDRPKRRTAWRYGSPPGFRASSNDARRISERSRSEPRRFWDTMIFRNSTLLFGGCRVYAVVPPKPAFCMRFMVDAVTSGDGARRAERPSGRLFGDKPVTRTTAPPKNVTRDPYAKKRSGTRGSRSRCLSSSLSPPASGTPFCLNPRTCEERHGCRAGACLR